MQEDIITKLLEFLVSPHATTTVLLAEKEKVSILYFLIILSFWNYAFIFSFAYVLMLLL